MHAAPAPGAAAPPPPPPPPPLVSRSASAPLAAAATRLPWFGTICGYTLVPAPGGAAAERGAAATVLTLLEGGELSVHELSASGSKGDAGDGAATAAAAEATAAAAPGPGRSRGFRARFQALPKVTTARLRVVPTAHVPLQGMQVRGKAFGLTMPASYPAHFSVAEPASKPVGLTQAPCRGATAAGCSLFAMHLLPCHLGRLHGWPEGLGGVRAICGLPRARHAQPAAAQHKCAPLVLLMGAWVA
jgi:hypothetical protein